VRSVTAFWRFFITIDGYIGLGPADTKDGDQVGILLSSSTPFVLPDH